MGLRWRSGAGKAHDKGHSVLKSEFCKNTLKYGRNQKGKFSYTP